MGERVKPRNFMDGRPSTMVPMKSSTGSAATHTRAADSRARRSVILRHQSMYRVIRHRKTGTTI